MIADLITWSLAFHAPVSGFAWLSVFKCGGESKFGKQSQDEMKEIRSALLRSISTSLAANLEPILTLANTVEVPKLIVTGDDEVRASPTITPIGGEKLLNAVRDFVKSDVKVMLALRKLDAVDSCITSHLNRLRLSVLAAAIASGVFALVACIMKTEAFKIASAWPYIVAFAVVVVLLSACAYCALRVIIAVNSFERLRETHGDFS